MLMCCFRLVIGWFGVIFDWFGVVNDCGIRLVWVVNGWYWCGKGVF